MPDRENQQTIQKEIRSELFLCDSRGRLNLEAVGWARHPHQILNLHGNFPFKKSWERWEVFGDQAYAHIAAAHFEHTAVLRADVLNLKTGRVTTRSTVARFPETRGVRLGERWSDEFQFALRGDELGVRPGPMAEILAEQPRGGPFKKGLRRAKRPAADRRRLADALSLRMAATQDGEALAPAVTAELTAQRPMQMESLNVTAAWSRRRFAWLSRQLYPECSGRVVLGNETLEWKPKHAVAAREVLRGVLPYSSNGRRALCLVPGRDGFCGFTAGSGWSLGSGMNENGIVLDGRLYKLYDAIQILPADDGRTVLRTLSSSAVDLSFEPLHLIDHQDKFLFLRLSARRAIGRFTGQIRVGSRVVAVKGAPGSLEDFESFG